MSGSVLIVDPRQFHHLVELLKQTSAREQHLQSQLGTSRLLVPITPDDQTLTSADVARITDEELREFAGAIDHHVAILDESTAACRSFQARIKALQAMVAGRRQPTPQLAITIA